MNAITREVLRSLKNPGSLDAARISSILNLLLARNSQITETLSIKSASKFIDVRNEQNLRPLLSMLQERRDNMAFNLNQYQFLIQQSETDLISIGRRGQDIIREISMHALEKGFIGGNARAIMTDEISQKLLKRKLYSNELDARSALKTLDDEIRAVPVFKGNDGRPRFLLHVRPYQGKYMSFDIEKYAELVAQTTTREAEDVANLQQANEIQTRFIKFNHTGKDYIALKDDRCAAIDGKIFATVPGGAVGESGKFYPYIRDVLSGPFFRPHPFCRHFFRPYPEALA